MVTAANVLSLDISPGLLALGVISGMTYGILAVGLVLVYRSSKVINFAHGEIGAFGAAITGVMVVRWSLPYWVALAVGIAASALVGGATEAVVVRRLRRAPRLMSLVATLGVAQFLLALSSAVNAQARAAATFPQPPGLPEFHVGVFLVTRAYTAMLLLSPVVVIALVLFLQRSSVGIAMRASSANRERALMAGISAGRMSTLAWLLAGALGALTTAFIIPTRGFISAEALGPVLLLRALAPAVVARMSSLPVALGAGVGLGVADQILIFNYPTSGISELALLVFLVVALLFQARGGTRDHERDDWSTVSPWPALPDAVRALPSVRLLGPLLGVAGVVVGVVVGALSSNSTAVTLVAILCFALIGLSLGITTGLGGQLSLGQFALAGVGATASYVVVDRWANFPVALVAATLAAALVSVLLGLPALRVRGLLLGVITLSFALAAQRWVFAQTWALDIGVLTGRPVFGDLRIASTRAYYFWTLAVFVVALLVARNVWRGGIGLRLRAVRDNEDALRAFGVSPTAVKMQGFVIAGGLAGLAGSLYGHLFTRISAETFDVSTSISVVALTVLGGIGLLTGPLFGALYIIGLPRFLPLDNAGLAATSLGWLLLILYFPGGIAQLIAGPRRRLLGWLASREGLSLETVAEESDGAGDQFARPRMTVTPSRDPSSGSELLRARDLAKSYGGIDAVRGVDVTLGEEEILGLLGPNGAGKTTLFELLGGFTVPDRGSVRLRGREIGRLPAQARARLGLIRSFQDAALFPTLTVLETVVLAGERKSATRFAPSLLGLHGAERAKVERARELVALMGLDSFRNKEVRELSTGTRRITELACIVALEPTVLLLDEPSSGIAQRESEALGELLLRLRDALRCSLVVIEHDIPLLMGLSDRVMAMDTGRVIASGSPDDVRRHPEVVESYLGTNVAAIERSGSGTANEPRAPRVAPGRRSR